MTAQVRNQYGQALSVGSTVAYVAKTGSVTTRRLGVVTALTKVKIDSYPNRYQDAVRIKWVLDGTWCDYPGSQGLVESKDADSTVRVNNVVRINPLTLDKNTAKAIKAVADAVRRPGRSKAAA